MGKIKLCINSLALVLLVLAMSPVQAYECVLDSDGDGEADGTFGASSGGIVGSAFRVACGKDATASKTASTALGGEAEASANFSTAFGRSAKAIADASTAVGYFAQAGKDNSTALGSTAKASETDSTALGQGAEASKTNSTAVGRNAGATGLNSTAVGRGAFASGGDSTAVGHVARATEINSTAVGRAARAHSSGSTSLGFAAGFNNNIPVINSPASIAIGNRSNFSSASPGAIAIGGDVNGDLIGAQATAPGAIAIGADVVADIANTLITNVPILARDPDTTVVPRTMFEISGFGNTKFTVTNADQNEQWAFANPGTGFRLSRQGSGSVEFEVKNNGNAVLAGTLIENSDINSKQDIQALDKQAILDKVMDLNISQWRYKDDPNSNHIGPMAQEFYQVFELGDTDKGISTLDSSGVALVAIQALKQENNTIQLENDSLKQRMVDLQNKLAELSVLVKFIGL